MKKSTLALFVMLTGTWLGCGSSTQTTSGSFTLGGSVIGLSGSVSVQNGNQAVTLTASGPFAFPKTLSTGDKYAVSVTANPTTQTCTVTNASGTVQNANITNIGINCASVPTYSLGGTVSGLVSGGSVQLQNDAGDTVTVTGNQPFTFTTTAYSGASYSVTVSTQPAGQFCSVASGQGIFANSNVTNVSVTCANQAYQLGGMLSGLAPGDSLTLTNNGSDSVTLSQDGNFTFNSVVPYQGDYNVQITAFADGQTCVLTGASGAVADMTVNSITVVCTSNLYAIGGSVSGLVPNGNIVLANNNADSLTVSANGNFFFPTSVAFQGSYSVSITTPPDGQTCTLQGAVESVGDANVTAVTIVCTSNLYAVGGSLSGLAPNGNVNVQLQGADTVVLSQNGSFNFATSLPFQAAYTVGITAGANGQTCTLQNGSGTGTVADTNTTSIAVVCVNNLYAVSGSVTGLVANTNVVLADNASDTLTVLSSGSFNFATSVPYQGNYNVTVMTQPVGQTCTLQNAAGAVGNANITNVAVSCARNRYAVGGALTGLVANTNVIVNDNGADALTLAANGSFFFPTSVAYQGNYNTTIATQPIGQTCLVVGAAGTVANSNITSVAITCNPNVYSVGAVVSGLTGSVTLSDGTDSAIVSTNGTATFPTKLRYGSTYSVNITGQPANQTCTLSNSSGLSVPAQNSSLTSVSCVGYTVGGTVSGLTGGNVTLTNGAQSTTVSTNGAFAFATTYPNNANYAVQVSAQYAENCNITNPNGTISAANVSSVVVACTQKLAFSTNQNAVGLFGQSSYTAGTANQGAGANGNTLNTPRGNAYVSNSNVVYVADGNNNRILGFNGLSFGTSDPNASVVVGQASSTAVAGATAINGARIPSEVSSNGTIFLAPDSNNNRVLWFGSLPTGQNANATGVVGQASYTSSTPGCSGVTLNSPRSAIIAAGQLIVADTNNNRVLIWSNPNAAIAQQNPNVVLGQANLTSCTAGAVSGSSLSAPMGVYSDGTQLFVSDSNNNRVLVWTSIAGLTSGQAANFAIGQSSLTASAAALSATGLTQPKGITGNPSQLFIADAGNHRVLVYTPVPTSSGASATTALGQVSFTAGTASTTQAGLKWPMGVALSNTNLLITDTGNSRVTVYTSN